MIQGKATDKLCIRCCSVLHRHDLNHVQIRLSGRSVNSKDGIDNVRGEFLRESTIQLCRQRGTSDRKQQLAVGLACDLELVKEL